MQLISIANSHLIQFIFVNIRISFFVGREYIQLDLMGIISGNPANITETFPGLPSFLDAALHLSDNIPRKSNRLDNGSVYFFKVRSVIQFIRKV